MSLEILTNLLMVQGEQRRVLLDEVFGRFVLVTGWQYSFNDVAEVKVLGRLKPMEIEENNSLIDEMVYVGMTSFAWTSKGRKHYIYMYLRKEELIVNLAAELPGDHSYEEIRLTFIPWFRTPLVLIDVFGRKHSISFFRDQLNSGDF